MADDPIAALTSPEPDLPDIPDKPDEVKVQVGGGTGARAGLTTNLRADHHRLGALPGSL